MNRPLRMNAYLLHTSGFDPYENLAAEEALLDFVAPEDCVLYLWQNEKTVVIGRNQNPWKECRLPLLEAEEVRLARRPSGGGAVYHDRGNLNFSFVAGSAVYDPARQTGVILRALRERGLPVEISGRNDLLLDGRKFSGHAYYRRKAAACHHGTLMVDVDIAAAQRCLTPARAKLEAKGVDSVRSRVVNLREFAPDLTVESLKTALESAFCAAYGAAETIMTDALDPTLLQRLTDRNRSDAWRFGTRFSADLQFERHFSWGHLELCFRMEGDKIASCRVYTDALDDSLSKTVESALTGVYYTASALQNALQTLPHGEDIAAMLCASL